MHNKFMSSMVMLLLVGLATVSMASGELFKWTDEHGNTHYSDTPPTDGGLTSELLQLPELNRLEHRVTPASNKYANGDPKLPLTETDRSPGILKSKLPELETCFSASPRATGIHLNKNQLTKHDHRDIEQMFLQIKGDWKGTALFTECRGEISNPKLKKNKYQAELEVKLRRSKELSLNFDMYSSDLGLSKKEEMEFFLSDKYLSLSQTLSDKSVMLELNSNGFSLWVAQFLGSGVHRELIRTVRITKDTLIIDQYNYANNALIQLVRWSMKKH